MSVEQNIIITVQGGEHSGKGNVIAAIAHALEGLGADVTVQLSETHNKGKLQRNDEELRQRLQNCSVLVLEQTT